MLYATERTRVPRKRGAREKEASAHQFHQSFCRLKDQRVGDSTQSYVKPDGALIRQIEREDTRNQSSAGICPSSSSDLNKISNNTFTGKPPHDYPR